MVYMGVSGGRWWYQSVLVGGGSFSAVRRWCQSVEVGDGSSQRWPLVVDVSVGPLATTTNLRGPP